MNVNGMTRGMGLVAALALCPILAPATAEAAQAPSVRVHVEPPEVTVGETLRVVLEIRGARDIEQVSRPWPWVRGLRRGFPSGTTVGVRVGEAGVEVAESSFTLSHEFVAIAAGSFEVGPFRVTADGQTIESELVAVRVAPWEGAEPTVVARVVPERVRVGDGFSLNAEIRGSSFSEHEFLLPDIFDFAESGGGYVGPTNRIWSLRALAPGEFVIPPVLVTGPGGTHESEPLTVVIDPAPVEVQATVEAESIWVGGEFTVKLEVTGAGELDREVVLPETDAFAELVELVDSSSSLPGMPGVRSVEREYRFRALQAGRFEIGPVRVAVAGRTLTTDPIGITVEEAPTLEVDPPTSLVVLGSPSKTRAFVNEPVIVAYALAHDPMADAAWPPMGLPGTASWPSFDGFQVLELRPWGGPDLVVAGRSLNARGLRRVALLPREPGRLRVEGAVAEARVWDRSSEWNTATGRPAMTSIVLASEPFTLEVLPLPDEGRPASFRGYVGALSIASWVDRTRLEVGETMTLEIEVSVEGHVEALPDPEIDFPDGLAVSEPEIATTFRDRRGELSGSRTYVYRVRAVAPGRHRIPAVEMSYFDAESESYGTARAQPFTVTVVPAGSEGR